MSFSQFGLSEEVLAGVRTAGYLEPTPIQSAAIPLILSGKDLRGSAETGTGKTAAFALPLLTLLGQETLDEPRVLVLTPTRELAQQVEQAITAYGRFTPLRSVVVVGGVDRFPQIQKLRDGVDILVATPGRLLDLLEVREVSFRKIAHCVVDEADRMLDMGFLPDLQLIISKLPNRRQTLLFSATFPREIQQLALDILREPELIDVVSEHSPKDLIEQYAYLVHPRQKFDLLIHLLETKQIKRGMIFLATRHDSDALVRRLMWRGLPASALHSEKPQPVRERALKQFREGRCWFLVSTDVAARGLDIEGMGHVINFDLPMENEMYIHRVGRTGRAGATGTAITLVQADELEKWSRICHMAGKLIPLIEEAPWTTKPPPPPTEQVPVKGNPGLAPERGLQDATSVEGAEAPFRRIKAVPAKRDHQPKDPLSRRGTKIEERTREPGRKAKPSDSRRGGKQGSPYPPKKVGLPNKRRKPKK